MARTKRKSLFVFVLIGFSIVAVPPFFAIYRAAEYVNDLHWQSERLVAQGVQFTRQSSRLAEHISELERNARQYQVLRDDALLELYSKKHERLGNLIDALGALDTGGDLRSILRDMRQESTAIYDQLGYSEARPNEDGVPGFDFSTLRALASRINDHGTQLIDGQLTTLEQTASRAGTQLWFQLAALVPIAVIVAIVFTVLITRPIRQLGSAIHKLGEGELSDSVSVSGPPELTSLGYELDWLRRRLVELEKEQNTFFRQMSHELKTPLASIREGADLLADGTIGSLSLTQSEVVDILRDSGLELESLIENLLVYNAWKESQAKLVVTDFSLLQLVSRIVDHHRAEVMRKNLSITSDVEDITVTGDQEKLRMAIDNVLSNAIKFSPRDEQITISAKQKQNQINIEISDAGPGIPKNERELIFKPFFRGEAPSASAVRGTGIGLSVVRECIQAHAGRIQLVDGRGNGAHFRITIPRITDAEAA